MRVTVACFVNQPFSFENTIPLPGRIQETKIIIKKNTRVHKIYNAKRQYTIPYGSIGPYTN